MERLLDDIHPTEATMATRITSDIATRRLAGMAADVYGEGDGRPALVLLHGLTYDRRIWQPVLDRLFTIDPLRQILVLDLPGHGESPDQFPHAIERVASLIHDAVDEAGLEAPVLVGHSISGGVASVYAGRYPSSGVINIDAAPDLASPARLLQSAVAQMGQADFMALFAIVEPTLHTELLPVATRQVVTSNSHPRPAMISYWANLLEETPEALTNWVDEEMAALAKACVPYLLIAGAELAVPLRESMVHAVPNAIIEVWAGSGHFPHLAHPDRFVDRLTATGQWRAGCPNGQGQPV
jgi:pimeloyl-ACP methyl ester carboxylesterase